MRDFTELVCWQLANELKCHVFDFTSEGPASRDFKFRDRIRDSSASAAANIAEGFGYYQPGEFARFLGYARASLIETRNHLLDAYQRNYIGETLYQHLSNLTRAATRMTTNLMLSKQRAAEVQRRRGRERTAEARRRRRRPAR